jgi:hypothetical protein
MNIHIRCKVIFILNNEKHQGSSHPCYSYQKDELTKPGNLLSKWCSLPPRNEVSHISSDFSHSPTLLLYFLSLRPPLRTQSGPEKATASCENAANFTSTSDDGDKDSLWSVGHGRSSEQTWLPSKLQITCILIKFTLNKNYCLLPGRPGLYSRQGQTMFLYSTVQNRLRSPPSLIQNGTGGSLPGSKAAWARN